MEKQVIALVENHISTLYQKARTMLSDKSNYTTEGVNLESVNLYLTFLEATLQKPYNRLNSLSVFVEDDCGLMMYRMYPFAFLSDQAKADIKELSIQAIALAYAMDSGGIDPDYKTFTTEEWLAEKSD